jgi:hypothetical protein
MPRRFRDVAITTAVLLVLFGCVYAFNQTARDRVTQFAGGNADQWMSPGRLATGVMSATGANALTYASANTYQVFFLIVGSVLFIVMLRT